MKTLPVVAAVLLALAAPLPAQICVPLMPSGQPALAPFIPPCLGVVPPPVVWGVGNPGFALSSFAPAPVPPGMLTFLLITTPAPPPVPVFAPLSPMFGLPGLLTGVPLIVTFAGPSGPLPGPAVPFPLPATGGPLGIVLAAHTLVVSVPGVPPFVALTGATGIDI
jgi:hypothetical protein